MSAHVSSAQEHPADAKSLPAELADVARRYSIQIETQPRFPINTTHGPIDGRPAHAAAIKEYAQLFAKEFAIYPPDLVKCTGLKKVTLCVGLSYTGQRRSGIPDFEHDTLLLDVKRGDYDKKYVRSVIHHEFFHIIDYRDDRKVYSDPSWVSLNADGFRYGTGGVNAQQNAMTGVLTDRYPGFLNHYSTTGVEEDKAELFCHMLISSKYVSARIRRDVVLKKKTERMKQLLQRFSSSMNDEFWQMMRE